jgi:hypothetical protein
MADRRWRTLKEISDALEYRGAQSAISARLRDLRKERFGAYVVLARIRKKLGRSPVFEYSVRPGPKSKGEIER